MQTNATAPDSKNKKLKRDTLMCIQMPFWIKTSSYFIQDWWFKTLCSKERVNVPDPIQVSSTSHHRHPIPQKGKYISNCHTSSLEGYVQLWFPSPTNPPNLLFPVLSGTSWWRATVQFGVGPVAWRLSQRYVFLKKLAVKKYDHDLLPQWRFAKSGQGPTIRFLQSKQEQTTNKSFLETATRTQTRNKTNNKQQNNQ